MVKAKNLSRSGGVWECQCGFIDYGEFPPEDCPKCFRVAKFTEVPEDMIEEREAEHIITSYAESEDEDEN